MHFLPPDRSNALHLTYSTGLQLWAILHAGSTRVWHFSPIVELTTKEGSRDLNDIFDIKMFLCPFWALPKLMNKPKVMRCLKQGIKCLDIIPEKALCVQDDFSHLVWWFGFYSGNDGRTMGKLSMGEGSGGRGKSLILETLSKRIPLNWVWGFMLLLPWWWWTSGGQSVFLRICQPLLCLPHYLL